MSWGIKYFECLMIVTSERVELIQADSLWGGWLTTPTSPPVYGPVNTPLIIIKFLPVIHESLSEGSVSQNVDLGLSYSFMQSRLFVTRTFFYFYF